MNQEKTARGREETSHLFSFPQQKWTMLYNLLFSCSMCYDMDMGSISWQ